MEVTDPGRVSKLRRLQLANAPFPMVVIEWPIFAETSSTQPWNARSPIEMTELRSAEERLEQLRNADEPRFLMLERVIEVRLTQPSNALTPRFEADLRSIVVRDVQFLKAELPIDVTESGMDISVTDLQP